MTTEHVDVLVVGGGMAGCTAASALAGLGRDVVVVDATVDRTKQLSGELIHPPGVATLRQLGLGDALDSTGARNVLGFAVISAKGDVQLLPYEEVAGINGQGASIEHASFTAALQDSVSRQPRVKLRRGSRVASLDKDSLEGDAVKVKLASGETLRARLVVAADGRGSPLRRMAGISESRTSLSTMAGITVPAELLPHEGFGHVFVEGNAMVLAYRVSERHARLMIDVPRSDDMHALGGLVESLPAPLRAAVRTELSRRPLSAANITLIPELTAKGRVALVGDAAGCCHPLTASGLTSCANDATALARSIQASGFDEREALRRYVRLRQSAQRTRINLATALYQVLGEPTPEMDLLRRGLFRYWRESPEGRSASMGLLSSHDARMTVMAREYARVMGHSVPAWVLQPRKEAGWRARSKTMLKMVRSAMPLVTQTVRGAFDDLSIPLLRS